MAKQLGLRRAVRVRIASETIGPAVFGLWRPVVVIPETMLREKTLPQIEPIVAHELVHVRRGDAYVGVLQMIVQVLWWFHPLVWWANREMGRRREQCCDEEVVAGLGCSSAAYARCLVDILEWQCRRSRRRLLSAVPGVRSAEITKTRLEHIMDDAKRFHGRTPRWIWGLLAMAMLLFLPGRAMVLGQNAESLKAENANPSAKSLCVLCRFTNSQGKMMTAPKMGIEPDGPAGKIVDLSQSPFVTAVDEIIDPNTQKTVIGRISSFSMRASKSASISTANSRTELRWMLISSKARSATWM
jgi:hypothetical protein